MTQKISAGLLMYRINQGELEVFLAHPGGPFYINKDKGVWSIPKGLVEDGEDYLSAAKREFFEETGLEPKGELIDLGKVRQSSGKIVYAWAFEGDYDPSKGVPSNHFEMQWPPNSGQIRSFPEIDQVNFFDLALAREKINPAQIEFLERLKDYIKSK